MTKKLAEPELDDVDGYELKDFSRYNQVYIELYNQEIVSAKRMVESLRSSDE